MSRRPRLLLVLAMLALSLLGGASASANAALPLTGFNDMLVDATHSHVFVTGAATDSTISVRNFDGTSAGNITGETGAGGMVLSGNTLYVARCGANEIDEIDTATLTKTGSFTAAVGGTCDLALAGGRLWYSNSTDAQFGHLVSVSLDSSHTEIDTGINMYQMIFATTPAHPNWLVVSSIDEGPVKIYLEDVTDPSNVTQASVSSSIDGVADFAITPDGSTLLAAADGVQEYSLPGLVAGTTYTTDNGPNSVAIAPTGTKYAAGAQAPYSTDVFAFTPGTTTATAKTDFNDPNTWLKPRGLAFSPDGSQIFAISYVVASSNPPVFRVIPTVPLKAGSLTIKHSVATLTNGKPVTLTVHLGTASSAKTVSIYRKLATASTPVLLHTGKVNASGNLTFVARPNQDTLYTARWAGDSTHKATTSAAVRTNVHAVMHLLTQGGYKTASGVRLYHYSSSCPAASHKGCPMFMAYSGPLQPGRTLSFVVQGRAGNSGKWSNVLKGSHAAGGNGKFLLTVYYTSKGFIGINQRIRFSIGKTPSNLGATSAWKPFRVTS